MLEQVREGQPEPPTRIEPRVPKPLEAICQKAMQRDPADRYPSATALADDLERWLADQPVSVYRDPWLTRITRWGRHHRTVAATSLVLLLSAILGLAGFLALVSRQKSAIEAKQAEVTSALASEQSARKLAEKNLKTGLKINDRLIEMADGRSLDKLEPEFRMSLLQDAWQFNEYFAESPENDVQRRSAQTAIRLANVLRYFGEYSRADEVYARALATLDQLRPTAADQPDTRDRYAEALCEVGDNQLYLGRNTDGGRLYDLALAEARKNVPDANAPEAYRRTLGRLLDRRIIGDVDHET